MANTSAPFGFRLSRLLNGSSPNFAPSTRSIASGNGTAIFHGDPVTSLTTGFIARSTAGVTQIAGIFVGCQYLSIAQKRTVWSNYWPGSDAAGDVKALIIDSPVAVFLAQSNGTAVGLADIQANVNFALGTGNTNTGMSGATIDQSSILTTTTLPFRIIDLFTAPPGANGTDSTTSFNYAYVAFNFQDFKSQTGI